jgi:vitamin-K-epoxide reductase (warfarin-sensitive)
MRNSFKIVAVALFGLVVSGYAVHVETERAVNPQYSALCDFGLLGWTFSCSKVFESPYGHIFFDIPNAVFGCMWFVGVLCYPVFTCIPFRQHIFYGACVGVLAFSAYLAYALIFILQDVCVVCISSYVANVAMFLLARSEVANLTKKKKKN